MTPPPTARTTHARRAPSARWFTAPLVALALLGTGAGPSAAAPADDAEHFQYVQSESEPAFTDPSARADELPPYDARDAQQAVDEMVMDEEEDAEGQHCPPTDDENRNENNENRQGRYERWGPHRDAAYPADGLDGGGDGQDTAPARDLDEPESLG
ncbi:hypothetical protein ABZ726_00560 [Streptomyces hundungensis]|uniref:hypothetical protein n=1 Tax=Streptomyces hundungensis TaxID=1077946 RepID=UPI0033C77453